MSLNQSTPETGQPLLKVEGVSKYFMRDKSRFAAVEDVSVTLNAGETLGIVGESGSGKSTLSRCIIRLYDPEKGRIFFDGVDFTALSTKALRTKRRNIQMIFQDPLASLNPMMTVHSAIEDPMLIHNVGSARERTKRVHELLELVGLDIGAANAFPFEFSGGQQQRIGIARALALNPKLLICDEAVSALDVSIQAQILRLLQDLQKQLGLAYLFISHNLAVVEHMSDQIAVMYHGKVVEYNTAEEIFRAPKQEYTRNLIDSVPKIPRSDTMRFKRPRLNKDAAEAK
ncbi:ATP-binding cassette domain-containing protein [Herpetosiphon giganteus]|uniref:ATP-binding cassette domain-containing protein n=1 Tax=Herpetosiphon giganteus TaxID=2029754 RepID=UPI00195B1D06|nr:ATP-binding cassette domain-containing protein [Herpetosiphon giganteus]MBM7846709.1 peptide/nickel transport system ATP-binding protein [Herpetosiphon giganteus]